MRVLYYGEKPTRSSPSSSIAALLEPHGYTPVLQERAAASTKEWIRVIRKVDLINYVGYGAVGDWFIRLTRIARALGTPLIRWWVGTDVLNALQDPEIAEWARRLDRHVSQNVAVAQHLKEELAQIGIQASVIPLAQQSLDCHGDVEWDQRLAQSVLVYFPNSREDFYGSEILDTLIQSHTNLTFYLTANDGQRYSHCENVVALGWVEDIEQIYRKVGCLLRLTKHDGCPRMVLEALARGKYVVYSWPFEGCILARTLAEADAALMSVAGKTSMNYQGIEAIRRSFRPEEVFTKAAGVIQLAMYQRRMKAFRAGLGLIPNFFKAVLQKC